MNTCPVIVRNTRRTGEPPRCRWCGAVCHPRGRINGGAFERACQWCQSYGRPRAATLTVAAWSAGAPLDAAGQPWRGGER